MSWLNVYFGSAGISDEEILNKEEEEEVPLVRLCSRNTEEKKFYLIFRLHVPLIFFPVIPIYMTWGDVGGANEATDT